MRPCAEKAPLEEALGPKDNLEKALHALSRYELTFVQRKLKFIPGKGGGPGDSHSRLRQR